MSQSFKPTHEALYWDEQYAQNRHGWDIGAVSAPLKAYFDQLSNPSLRILIPGAGFGWEAGYLNSKGFDAVFVLDFSKTALKKFQKNFPLFPSSHILREDFFQHTNTYDLIVEQTFFSGIPRHMRQQYAKHTAGLLNKKGKLMGLLFNHEFDFDGPPYGGNPEEYKSYFEPYFNIIIFETAYNSIKPRIGRELFLLLEKK